MCKMDGHRWVLGGGWCTGRGVNVLNVFHTAIYS